MCVNQIESAAPQRAVTKHHSGFGVAVVGRQENVDRAIISLNEGIDFADDVGSSALQHFVRLANRGKHSGSSGGEKAARKMALLMLNEGLRLDGSAIEGLIDFIRGAKMAPESARDLVNGW